MECHFLGSDFIHCLHDKEHVNSGSFTSVASTKPNTYNRSKIIRHIALQQNVHFNLHGPGELNTFIH